MRLRPSGRSGPVATSLASFRELPAQTEAWTWEHMALTRARVVSASPAFAAQVEQAIHAILCLPRDAAIDRRRRRRDAPGDRDRKGRSGALEPQIRRRRPGRSRIHRAVPPARPRRGHARTFSTRRRSACWRRRAARPSDGRGRRGAAPGGAALSRPDPDSAAVPHRAVRSGHRRRGLLGLLTRAADVPDIATLEAHLVETQERVRRSFIRILGAEP